MRANGIEKFNIAIRIRPTLEEDLVSYQAKDTESTI